MVLIRRDTFFARSRYCYTSRSEQFAAWQQNYWIQIRYFHRPTHFSTFHSFFLFPFFFLSFFLGLFFFLFFSCYLSINFFLTPVDMKHIDLFRSVLGALCTPCSTDWNHLAANCALPPPNLGHRLCRLAATGNFLFDRLTPSFNTIILYFYAVHSDTQHIIHHENVMVFGSFWFIIWKNVFLTDS